MRCRELLRFLVYSLHQQDYVLNGKQWDVSIGRCTDWGCACVCSMEGDWKGALRVRQLMRARLVPLTVHVYNALIAACERAQQW